MEQNLPKFMISINMETSTSHGEVLETSPLLSEPQPLKLCSVLRGMEFNSIFCHCLTNCYSFYWEGNAYFLLTCLLKFEVVQNCCPSRSILSIVSSIKQWVFYPLCCLIFALSDFLCRQKCVWKSNSWCYWFHHNRCNNCQQDCIHFWFYSELF